MASSPYLRLLESVASGQLDENEALSALINAGLAQALPRTEPRAIAKKMLQQRALHAAKKMALPAAGLGALGLGYEGLHHLLGGSSIEDDLAARYAHTIAANDAEAVARKAAKALQVGRGYQGIPGSTNWKGGAWPDYSPPPEPMLDQNALAGTMRLPGSSALSTGHQKIGPPSTAADLNQIVKAMAASRVKGLATVGNFRSREPDWFKSLTR